MHLQGHSWQPTATRPVRSPCRAVDARLRAINFSDSRSPSVQHCGGSPQSGAVPRSTSQSSSPARLTSGPRPTARMAPAAAAAVEAPAPPAAHAVEPPAKLEQFLGEPVIFGPSKDCTAGRETEALLMLAPGAFIPASDYEKLATAVQEATSESVRLTVGVASLNWLKVVQGGEKAQNSMTSQALFSAMVDSVVAAAGSYLDVKKTQTGRYEDNVFVGGHSIMGCAAVRYAQEQAGGLILLGSAMLPGISGLWPTSSTWTRPVLQLSGELDGQQYLSKQALGLIDTVETAARLGYRHAATFQPNLIVEGEAASKSRMNHAQFASGHEKKMNPGDRPLDLEPSLSHEEAVEQAGELIAHFLTAHCGSGEDVQSSVRRLMIHQRISASIVDPFLDALGRGKPLKAVGALEGYADMPKRQALRDANIIPMAFGAERLQVEDVSRKWVAHPGELVAAETFAAGVQRSAVPKKLVDRVIVAVTVHTDETTFLYNQPTIDPVSGGKVLVHAHVHLWRHNLEVSERRAQLEVAPEYAMKLRTGSAICRALGEDDEAERLVDSNLKASDINERTFAEAWEVTRKSAQDRYKQRGKRYTFGNDAIEGPASGASPKNWVQAKHVSFEDVSETETKITSPTYGTWQEGEAAPKLPSYSRGRGRFVGNHYIKVVSPARAIEWLMIDTLRPAKLKHAN